MVSKWDKYGPSPPGTGDLSPLSHTLHGGLIAIGALAVASLVLCALLFLFITWRLVDGTLRAGRRGSRAHRDAAAAAAADHTDGNGAFLLDHPTTPMIGQPASFSSAPPMTPPSPDHKRGFHIPEAAPPPEPVAVPNIRERYKGYHPLLVLIYMLLIADIIQSASFIPNLTWVAENAISVRTSTCWAQGWLRSHGDMASSLFAAAVSVNTYLMVVRGYTIPSKLLWAIVGSIWSFSFLIVAAGVWAADNGTGRGGYFVRVDTWCWISSEFASARLWTHFGWVLACFATIVIAYLATIIHIRPSRRWFHVVGWRNPRTSGHHPAFFIYPLVYFLCCAPMAVGPMILMAGISLNGMYFTWAGAMIASNGFLDVLIWSCTMVFLAPKDIRNAGLEDFRFLRTDSVKYGNMVWVEGGGGDRGERKEAERGLGRSWFGLRKSKSDTPWDKQRCRRSSVRSEAVDNTYGGDNKGIQIQMSTMVLVEDRRNSNGLAGGAPPRPRRGSDVVSVPARVAHRF